jgi:hypothetical protein
LKRVTVLLAPVTLKKAEAQKLGLEQELHKLLVVVQFRTQVALVKTYPVAQTAHWFGPLQEVQLDNVHKKH